MTTTTAERAAQTGAPEMVRVLLFPDELEHAWRVGMARQTHSMAKNSPSKMNPDHSAHRQMGNHCVGTVGEYAVAKLLGIDMDLTCDTYKSIPDVGEYEVRTRRKIEYELNIRPGDPDRIFVLAYLFEDPAVVERGQQCIEVKVAGWTWAHDARAGGEESPYWKNPGGYGFAHFVPRQDLRPMRELIEREAVKAEALARSIVNTAVAMSGEGDAAVTQNDSPCVVAVRAGARIPGSVAVGTGLAHPDCLAGGRVDRAGS